MRSALMMKYSISSWAQMPGPVPTGAVKLSATCPKRLAACESTLRGLGPSAQAHVGPSTPGTGYRFGKSAGLQAATSHKAAAASATPLGLCPTSRNSHMALAASSPNPALAAHELGRYSWLTLTRVASHIGEADGLPDMHHGCVQRSHGQHDLLVRAHVRRHDLCVRGNEGDHLLRIPPRDRLELATGQVVPKQAAPRRAQPAAQVAPVGSSLRREGWTPPLNVPLNPRAGEDAGLEALVGAVILGGVEEQLGRGVEREKALAVIREAGFALDLGQPARHVSHEGR